MATRLQVSTAVAIAARLRGVRPPDCRVTCTIASTAASGAAIVSGAKKRYSIGPKVGCSA